MSLLQKTKSHFGYLFGSLSNDIPAGIAVFFVAIPLCLGIAHASGAPLISGVLSGVLGGIVVGFISRSALSVSGPAAGLTAVVLAGIHELNGFSTFLVAVFLAGIIQIILGIARAGWIASYIPFAVIKGMLSAIGIILLLKNIPHLLGFDVESISSDKFKLDEYNLNELITSPELLSEAGSNTFSILLHSFQHINWFILLIGISTLVIIQLWEKHKIKKLSLLPSPLVAVIWGTSLCFLLISLFPSLALGKEHYVNLPTNLSLDLFTMPDWSAFSNYHTFIIAIELALIASLETLLCIKAVDKLDPLKRRSPANRELVAQGVANSMAGLIGALPITSVIVRSSLNISAGGRTQLSSITHGILLIVCVLFFAWWANQIPIACLSAILISIGYKLVSPISFKENWLRGPSQFVPFVATIIGILLTDILIGVIIGLVLSMLFIVYNTYKAPSFYLINLDEHKKKIILGDNIFFLHKFKLSELLSSIPENTYLEIDGTRTVYIDNDILVAIYEFLERAKRKDITVEFKGLKQINWSRVE